MIVFDGMELIGLALFGALLVVLLVVLGILFVIDRIAYALKKHQQKRIDDAYKEEGE